MITIKRVGTAITIVDKGRYGNRSYGIPSGGAMDVQSAFAANSLVNNPSSAPLIELYQSGHQLEFTVPAIIGLAGAEGDIRINQHPINSRQAIRIKKGDLLEIGKLKKGVRIYLAVARGIVAKEYFGSKSQIPFYSSDRIKSGDQISIATSINNAPQSNSKINASSIDLSTPLLFNPGPEWHVLTEASQVQLLKETFKITKYNDRMGYKLEGPALEAIQQDILSSAVLPGTIQLLPSGQVIILMRDCQTTGGYPRIGQLYPQHINQLAQRSTGQEVQFDQLDL